MKNLLRILSVCVIVGFVFVLSGFAPTPNSAVVIHDFGCNVFDGDGNLTFTEGTVNVVTYKGVGHIICKAKGVANSTGKAVHWDFESTNVPCNIIGLGLTNNWKATISAKGNSSLVCHLK